MTLFEFAKEIAIRCERMVARRYGITTVDVMGDEKNPLIHILNTEYNLETAVPASGPFADFKAHGETEIDSYVEALVFEIEYALFESMDTNHDVEKYADFSEYEEMLYTKLLDVDRSQGMMMSGVLGQKVDEFSVMAIYIHDGHTKTMVNQELAELWQVAPGALFIKASENTGR